MASISKQTNHINIRYYFLTCFIERDKIYLEWCPTSYMIGDFMGKPTQDVAFNIIQDHLKGVNEAQDPGPGKPKNTVNIK